MRPNFLVLILIISVPLHSYTQEKKASKSTGFYSIASAGYVFGESGVYPVAQLCSGIRMKDIVLSHFPFLQISGWILVKEKSFSVM